LIKISTFCELDIGFIYLVFLVTYLPFNGVQSNVCQQWVERLSTAQVAKSTT